LCNAINGEKMSTEEYWGKHLKAEVSEMEIIYTTNRCMSVEIYKGI